MTDYTITTDFGAKDSLPSGNAAKIIKGSEFTTEFTNILTAVNSKADTAGDTFTGAVTFDGAVTLNADVTFDTNTMFVDVSENRVGIGTTSPDKDLHITATTYGPTIRLERNQSEIPEGGVIGAIEFESRDASTGSSGVVGKIDVQAKDTSPDTRMSFYTHENNSGTGSLEERMRIDAEGNVGIGTTSPAVKLDVTEAYDTVANVLSNGSYAAKFSSSGSGDTGRTQGILLSGADANTRGVALLAEAQASNNAHDFVIATSAASSTPTERVRIDASGNVGIGVTSPAQPLHAYHATTNIVGLLESGDTTCGIDLKDSAATGRITNTSGKLSIQADTGAEGADSRIDFKVDDSEKMRIDASGNVLVGKTSASSYNTEGLEAHNEGLLIATRDDNVPLVANRKTSDGAIVSFRKDNTTVGSISVTGSATSYNTSSDERLKENITDSADAGSKIDAIQIRQFDWIADGSHQDYGVIAQELINVAPEAVSEGDTEEDMMGVDYSKLVPMLIKEVQTLRNRVAQLENN